MKVTINPESKRRDEYIAVFGAEPIYVENTAKGYRVDLAALRILQRRRLVQHVAKRGKIPADIADAKITRKGVLLEPEDVIVIEELQF